MKGIDDLLKKQIIQKGQKWWHCKNNWWRLICLPCCSFCVDIYVSCINFSVMSWRFPVFLGWTSTKKQISVYKVTLVSLEIATVRSRVQWSIFLSENHWESRKIQLTLVLLNPGVSLPENTVYQDHLAFCEASWSEFTLYSSLLCNTYVHD